MEEFKMNYSLKHDFIIQVFQDFIENNEEQDERIYYIVMEKGDKNLKTQLQEWKNEQNWIQLHQTTVILYMYQISTALAYIHSQNIIHRDIKPENIIIFSKNNQTCAKIGDFGIANKTQKYAYSCVGTFSFMAPEILIQSENSKVKYTEKADIWSLGCVFYELCTGTQAFSQDYSVYTLLQQVEQQNYDLNLIVDEKCKILISKMIIKNPQQRISMNCVVSSDVFENFNNIKKIQEQNSVNISVWNDQMNNSEMIKCIRQIKYEITVQQVDDVRDEQTLQMCMHISFPNDNNIVSIIVAKGKLQIQSNNIQSYQKLFTGKGILIYSNGDKYFGEVKSNMKEGYGEIDGMKPCKGQFKNDKLNGLGTQCYADGSFYWGEFKEGCYLGQGKFAYANGANIEGKFNHYQCIGWFTDVNGRRKQGTIEFDQQFYFGPCRLFEDESKKQFRYSTSTGLVEIQEKAKK